MHTFTKKWALAALLAAQGVFAQERISTSLRTEEVASRFLENNTSNIEIPISNVKSLNLDWEERESSFTKTEGIRTFVGYQNGKLSGIVSVSRDKKVSGTVYNDGKEFSIKSENDFLTVSKEDDLLSGRVCGTKEEEPTTSVSGKTKYRSTFSEENARPIIPNDGVLRIYRTALAISYDYYMGYFKQDDTKIKHFWAQAETYLNEMYLRDIGVKFEVINNDKLIVKKYERYSPSNNSLPATNSYKATQCINDSIGKNSYDIGAFIVGSKGPALGSALVGGAYNHFHKANCISITSLKTLAHEFGHLFGSDHTHSLDGYKTEPARGRSIMTWGGNQRGDYFSLISISRIRKKLTLKPYYSDTARTILVNEKSDIDNPTYGIKLNTESVEIDTTKVKKEYTIPQDTFFQFYIPVKTKSENLLYSAHQADFYKPIAKFLAYPAQSNNVVSFHPTYTYYPSTQKIKVDDYSTPSGTGEYTFWLGATYADTSKDYINRKDHYVMHDVVETKLKIVEGTPFKFTNQFKGSYKTGEHIILKWSVDKKIFVNTKVRILLSDDFGKTYKYILNPSTENDGECEVVLPQETIGRIQYGNYPSNIAGAVIKVEIIGNPAYAVSHHEPVVFYNSGNSIYPKGGFTLEKSKINFSQLPERYIVLKKGKDVPPMATNVTATTSCTKAGGVTIAKSEVKNENITTRTWTATDKCGSQSSFVQIIVKEEDETLTVKNEVESTKETLLYPNPASDLFKIKTSLKIEKVEVYDLSGKLVKRYPHQESYFVKDIPKGVYMIVVTTSQGVKYAKLLKK